MAKAIAAKLRDPQAVARARVLPYQLMSAFKAAGEAVPAVVQDARRTRWNWRSATCPACTGGWSCVPTCRGPCSPVTGWAGSATSTVRCVDVAALVAAAVLRKNRRARVLPFDFDVVDLRMNPRDSVMTNAQKLAGIGGGGTAARALARLNRERAQVDLVILVSDNESWMDARRSGATATMREWETLSSAGRAAGVHRHPAACDHAGCGTRGHPERGRFFRRRVRDDRQLRRGAWAPATGSARLKR